MQPVKTERLIILIFAILGLVGILRHGMWRDEMNTWLIVRDSQSLVEMLGYVRYQGHPALWALLTSSFRAIAATPVSMQILHWLLGVTAIAIFWHYSRFTTLQKVLFSFGYLPFFEYFLISRPYVLGLLFTFIFCAVYESRKQTYIPCAIALSGLANSHAYGLLMSFALLLTLAIEIFLDSRYRQQHLKQRHYYDFLISLVVILVGYTFAVYILTPPADSTNTGGRAGLLSLEFNLRHLLKVIGRLLGGYTLIIPSSRRWLDLLIGDTIGLMLFGLTCWKLSSYRSPLLFYVTANLLLLAFNYKYLGYGARHYGFFFVILLAALWLHQSHRAAKLQSPETSQGRSLDGNEIFSSSVPSTLDAAILEQPKRFYFPHKIYNLIFTTLLMAHLLGGVYRFGLDLALPLSAGRATARYIQANNLQAEFIVGSPGVSMASISGYLNRKLYYPQTRALSSFTIFNQNYVEVSRPEVFNQVAEILNAQPNISRILLILDEELEFPKMQHSNLEIEPIEKFEQAWNRGERFYLYAVQLRTKA